MSKIGRKAIELNNVQVEIQDKVVRYTGKRASGVYTLPSELKAEKKEGFLYLAPNKEGRDLNRIWGLHRALLANQIKGASVGFTKQLEIIGLGYKATASGNNKIIFSLGYSHKVEF